MKTNEFRTLGRGRLLGNEPLVDFASDIAPDTLEVELIIAVSLNLRILGTDTNRYKLEDVMIHKMNVSKDDEFMLVLYPLQHRSSYPPSPISPSP